MSSTNYSVVSSGGDVGFARYLSEVNRIPSLTIEEEFSYAKKYLDFGDIEAAQKLVSSHLKLVAKVAMNYRWYGLSLMELVSEGNIGLMQAVKKFDPEKGFRLSTYAVWWIKAAIQEFVLKSWSLVKIGTTAAQKKLFFNLGKIRNKIRALESREFSSNDYERVAAELDVTKEEVAEMDARLFRDYSLDQPISEDSSTMLLDVITDENDMNQEDILFNNISNDHRKTLFKKAYETLNDREKHIIKERRLKEVPTTLDTLANFYSISKERVRQIEEKAYEKLCKNILNS